MWNPKKNKIKKRQAAKWNVFVLSFLDDWKVDIYHKQHWKKEFELYYIWFDVCHKRQKMTQLI